jgi:hypothetical protein
MVNIFKAVKKEFIGSPLAFVSTFVGLALTTLSLISLNKIAELSGGTPSKLNSSAGLLFMIGLAITSVSLLFIINRRQKR